MTDPTGKALKAAEKMEGFHGVVHGWTVEDVERRARLENIERLKRNLDAAQELYLKAGRMLSKAVSDHERREELGIGKIQAK